jgi:hypothetical protein
VLTYLDQVAADTLADAVLAAAPPAGVARSSVRLVGGPVEVGLRVAAADG